MGWNFRPETDLDVYLSVNTSLPPIRGSRSLGSTFSLSWTILDLGRSAPPERCCHICNPSLLEQLAPTNENDPRLHAIRSDFEYHISGRQLLTGRRRSHARCKCHQQWYITSPSAPFITMTAEAAPRTHYRNTTTRSNSMQVDDADGDSFIPLSSDVVVVEEQKADLRRCYTHGASSASERISVR